MDKFPYAKLCEHNPDVPQESIKAPDIVCDTMGLDGIATASVDFVIASHVIEHVPNPIHAFYAWHRVLRPGGLALCIVPDARFTFDKGRELTSFEHLLWDSVNDGTRLKKLSDLWHIAECSLNMHSSLTPESAMDLAKEILADSYDTHFHVWTYASFLSHLTSLTRVHGLPFRVRMSACDGRMEMLFLLEALSPPQPYRFRGKLVGWRRSGEARGPTSAISTILARGLRAQRALQSRLMIAKSAFSRLRSVRAAASHLSRRWSGVRKQAETSRVPDTVGPADSNPFARRDEIRFELAAPFLKPGTVGIEIGAGAFPSQLPAGVRCEHFDKRGAEALSEYFHGAPTQPAGQLDEIRHAFPGGADFLIAHNVLEHTANPIGTLIQWFDFVKKGGIVVLSLPHREFCPGDSRRPLPTIEHLLLDYLTGEQCTSFGAREHLIAGCVGWAADWPEVSKNEFASGVLQAAAGPDPEHHFHVFDDQLAEQVVTTAMWFYKCGELLLVASPHKNPATVGDIILIVRLVGDAAPPPAIAAMRAFLGTALDRLG
ncbi:MAG TPA: methyltransferase domain-containing protein [Candidatus Binatia bacterium]|nr:methyltransferase domain-containing protein [Candidatus Binatia bacterium]